MKFQGEIHFIVIQGQAALVICRFFSCDFAYMQMKICHFIETYPPIFQCYWPRYMFYFLGPNLSHITRAACTRVLNYV